MSTLVGQSAHRHAAARGAIPVAAETKERGLLVQAMFCRTELEHDAMTERSAARRRDIDIAAHVHDKLLGDAPAVRAIDGIGAEIVDHAVDIAARRLSLQHENNT